MSQVSQEKTGEASDRKRSPGKTDDRMDRVVKDVVVQLSTANAPQMTESMRKVGYHESYHPNELREKKTWSELMDESLSDMKLMEWHNRLGGSMNIDRMTFDADIDTKEIQEMIKESGGVMRKVVHNQENDTKIVYFFYPNAKAMEKALDMAYKLKGKYAPEEYKDVSKYKDLSTSELLEKRKKMTDFYKKRD